MKLGTDVELRSPLAVAYPPGRATVGSVAEEHQDAVASAVPDALFVVGGTLRLLAWLLLLSLTAALLLYPVQVGLSYSRIQSLDVIGDIPLFGALYYAWLVVLLALLLSKAGNTVNQGEKAALVGLFALVFWGFWVVAAPEGQSEEPGFLAYARFLEDTGHISLDAENLGYFDFPGLGLLAYALGNVVGLSHLDARTALLLFNAVLMAVLIYEGGRRVAGKQAGWLYLLSVPLLVQGSMFLSVSFFFRPEAALALPLFLVLLILLVSGREDSTFFGRWQSSLLGLILFGALMITHFMTALAFIAVLLGVWAVRAMAGTRTTSAWSTILLFAVMTAAWQVYYAVKTFGNIVDSVPYFLGLLEEGSIFFYAGTLGSANAGPDVPLWASSVRLFWLVALFGLGGLLALLNLTRLRRLGDGERDYTGTVVGVAVMTGMAALVDGTGDQWVRFLEYGSFFVVPLVILFLARKAALRLVPALTLLAFAALSLPSFLAFHGQATVSAFYPQERGAAEFLARRYAGEQLAVYTGVRERLFYTYYFPNASFYSSAFGTMSREDVPVLWQDLGYLVDGFTLGGPAGRSSVFVLSEGLLLTYQHTLGILPEDPHWLDLKARLAGTNAFYDNGLVQLYAPVP